MKIAIIGTGNVGLVTGACLASRGHEVVCVDLDAERVAAINRSEAPFYEAGLKELLEETVPGRLSATTEAHDAALEADVSILTVGTPFREDHLDLSQVEAAATAIGRALRERSEYQLVLVKSTVLPGTTDEVVSPLLERVSGKRAGEDFDVAMNPEFLREGQAVADFLDPDRIVMGGSGPRAWQIQEALYEGIGSPELMRTSNATAESIKYASNALLATMISYSNEIANVCSTLDGVDVTDVLRGVHLDKRLSPRDETGERVEPGFLTYLMAGCGFGGSCLPKDVRSFVSFGRERGVGMDVLTSTLRVNAEQPERLVAKLAEHFDSLEGKTVALLGLAFKPGTSDLRETPAIPVAKSLLERGASLRVFDPAAQEAARKELGDSQVHYAESLEEVVERAAAVVLLTSWAEFQRLPEVLEAAAASPLVVDGRRVLDRDRIARYDGIGLGPQAGPPAEALSEGVLEESDDPEPARKTLG